jgi:hypothetical protein
MAHIKESTLEIVQGSSGPKAELEIEVDFTQWELQENIEVRVRAWLMERDGGRDNLFFYPNGGIYSLRTVDAGTRGDDDYIGYFGYVDIRPDGDEVQTITRELGLPASRVIAGDKESYDVGPEPEEYYAFVTATPLHTHVAMSFSNEVDIDLSP